MKIIFTVHSDVINKQDIYEPFGYEHSVTILDGKGRFRFRL